MRNVQLKLTRTNQREGDGKRAGSGRETGGGGQGLFWLSGAPVAPLLP